MKRTYRSAGAVVVSTGEAEPRVLLLEQVRAVGERQVVAPKGGIEPGESPVAAAAREAREEAGVVDLSFVGFLGEQCYEFTADNSEAAVKTVEWFLFTTASQHMTPQQEEGFVRGEWLTFDEAIDAATHPKFRNYLRRAQDVLAWNDQGVIRPEDDLAGARPRVAAGVLFLDDADRVMLVTPSYKEYLDLPGGMVEPGESPWAAARREVLEELGIEPPTGRLLVADWWRSQPDGERDEKLLFVFDGGHLSQENIETITVDGAEVIGFDFYPVAGLAAVTIPRLVNRIEHAVDAYRGGMTLYLEDGQPISAS